MVCSHNTYLYKVFLIYFDILQILICFAVDEILYFMLSGKEFTVNVMCTNLSQKDNSQMMKIITISIFAW